MKKCLSGRRFTSEEELKDSIEQHFAGLPKAFFFSAGMEQLNKRCNNKCC